MIDSGNRGSHVEGYQGRREGGIGGEGDVELLGCGNDLPIRRGRQGQELSKRSCVLHRESLNAHEGA